MTAIETQKVFSVFLIMQLELNEESSLLSFHFASS